MLKKSVLVLSVMALSGFGCSYSSGYPGDFLYNDKDKFLPPVRDITIGQPIKLHLISTPLGIYRVNPETMVEVFLESHSLRVKFYCSGSPVYTTNFIGRDKGYWNEDSVEVFVCVNNRNNYRHYIINTKGGLYDELVKDEKWNGDSKVKVDKKGSDWYVEIVIPAEDLGVKEFTLGMKVYANFVRNIGSNAGRLVWSATGPSLHNPARFGEFNVVGTDQCVFVDWKISARHILHDKNIVGDTISTLSEIRQRGYKNKRFWIVHKKLYEGSEISIDRERILVDDLFRKEYVVSHKVPLGYQFAVVAEDKGVVFRSSALWIDKTHFKCTAVSAYVFPGLDGGIYYQTDSVFLGSEMSVRVFKKPNNMMVYSRDGIKIQESKGVIRIPFNRLSIGNYIAEIKVTSSDKVEIRRYVEFIKPKTQIKFEGPKHLNINGEEIFVIGVWLPWPNIRAGRVIPEQSADQICKDLREIAKKGFNVVLLQTPNWYAKEAFKEIVEADKLGLKIFAHSNGIPILSKLFESEYNPSNLIGWIITDEPEDDKEAGPDAIRKVYFETKRKYPHYLCIVNHMWISAIEEYVGCRDVVSMDPYCIGPSYSFSMIPEFIRAMKRGTGGVIPCWVILQMHKIEGIYTLPTPAQMRAQSYLALLAGADGLIYYSTATPETPNWHIMKDPESRPLWEYMGELIREIKKNIKWFTDGKIIVSSHKNDMWEKNGIYWQVRKQKDEKVGIVVINANNKSVNISIPPLGKYISRYTFILRPYEVKLTEVLTQD